MGAQALSGNQAFNDAWLLMKALLPDLPDEMDATVYATQMPNFFSRQPNVNYDLKVPVESARNILDDAYAYPYGGYQLFLQDNMHRMRRELERNPNLLEMPYHILSRIAGRHSKDQQMPIGAFSSLVLDRENKEGLSFMDRYVDEMERRDSPVNLSTLQINPKTGEVGTLMTLPGFTGDRGTGVSIAEQLMGVALEHAPAQRLTDATFSPGGLRAFNRLGDRLTQGGEARLLPIEMEDDERHLRGFDFGHQQPFLVEQSKGPVRFTQQPLKVPNMIDPYRHLQFEYANDDFKKPLKDTMRVDPAQFYPYDFNPHGVRTAEGTRTPQEILYTGENNNNFISNL